MSNILSIHQPNFLPWVGFFSKIKQSDVFIILDTVQFPRGKTVGNRCQIKSKNGVQELVVPISRKNAIDGKVCYNKVEIGDNKWHKKTLKTIEFTYSKAPYFKDYFETIQEILSSNNFLEMNTNFIDFITKTLNINTKIVNLSDIENISTDQNQRIIDLCKRFNADIYLSGSGGKNYNDEELFNSNNIDISYISYAFCEYEQLNGEFINGLSIIDLIFNCGPNSHKYI